ncbi:hypothetical protein WJX84_002002 [Apatococcus fuscideae]|uniref:Uncharacterized protein n=1 Tax=Apatococcus fuscideae TaxID=2026836 RepID=A0AAW1THJ6_9CHLO
MLKALRRHWNCRLFENAFWQVRHRSEELVAGPAPGAAELNLNVPRWATSWLASQPVPREEVLANPTAQQWLRRRGPPGLSNAVLQALFRQRRVRIWSEQTQQLKRVSRNDVLPAGARLLVPPAAPHSHLGPTSPSPGVRSTGAACDPKTVSRMGSARLKLLAAELREQVLYENEDFVILNKPPGLAVQGGSRIPVSLDDILPLLFESDSGIRPRTGWCIAWIGMPVGLWHPNWSPSPSRHRVARPGQAPSDYLAPSPTFDRSEAPAADPLRRGFGPPHHRRFSARDGSNISEASSAHSAQRELDQLQSARDSAAAASNRLAVNSDHIIANCKNMGLYQLQRPQEPARVSGSSALENLTSRHESAEHSNQDTLLSNASTAWTNGQQNGRPAEPVAAPTVAVSMPVPAGASGSSADLMLHARTLCISRPGQETIEVTAPLPKTFAATMAALGWMHSDGPAGGSNLSGASQQPARNRNDKRCSGARLKLLKQQHRRKAKEKQ